MSNFDFPSEVAIGLFVQLHTWCGVHNSRPALQCTLLQGMHPVR